MIGLQAGERNDGQDEDGVMVQALKAGSQERRDVGRSWFCAGAAGLLILGVSAQASLACSWTHRPEPVGQPSGQFFAGRMMAEAAFVDLVVAESVRPSERDLGPAIATFRVLQPWKGGSPDRFTLLAAAPGGSEDAALELFHWVDAEGRVYPHPTPWEMPTSDEISLTTCDPGFIRPVPGRLYIVFRDAGGRLLGPVRIHEDEPPARAYPFVEVSGPRDWGWFDSVTTAGFRPPAPLSAVPAPAPDRALVVFREPVAPAAATAVLRRAGLRPHAVRIAFGDFIDEIRSPTDEGQADLVDVAARRALENLENPGAGDAAARWFTAETAEALDHDGWLRMHAVALIEGEDRRERALRAGSPRVASVEVSGSAAAISALAARSDLVVARLGDGAPPAVSSRAPTWEALDALSRDRPVEAIVADFRRLFGAEAAEGRTP